MNHESSGGDKGPLADANAAFIVRVWIEPREITDAPATWRGSIEYIGDGEKKYLAHLGEIGSYIRPFLEAMGVEFVG